MSTHLPADAASIQWRKSSYSNAGNQCVEVAQTAMACTVRDSKHPGGGRLIFRATSWRAFVADVKRGRYDL